MTTTTAVPVVSFGAGDTICSVAVVDGRDGVGEVEEAEDAEHPTAISNSPRVATVLRRNPRTRRCRVTGRV
jgi:hypothetical protein